ncbi:MAG: hypothetical protein WAU75_18065, partial [Solirubrobacteraceae bacterium]
MALALILLPVAGDMPAAGLSLPVPSPRGVAATVPTVTVPPVSVPSVTTPQVTTPQVTTPSVTTPSVTTPRVTTPTVTTPRVITPTVTTPHITTPPVNRPVSSPSVGAPRITAPAVGAAGSGAPSALRGSGSAAHASEPSSTSSPGSPAGPVGAVTAGGSAAGATGGLAATGGPRASANLARRLTPSAADAVLGKSLRVPGKHASPAVWTRYLRRLVGRLGGCLSAVAPQARRILVWRTGFGGGPAGSQRQVARRLGVGIVRERRLEREAATELRTTTSAGGCGRPG